MIQCWSMCNEVFAIVRSFPAFQAPHPLPFSTLFTPESVVVIATMTGSSESAAGRNLQRQFRNWIDSFAKTAAQINQRTHVRYYTVTQKLCHKFYFITSSNIHRFLADRTIGRAFGTLCRLSVVCRLWRFVLYPGKTAGPICMKFSGKVWTDHGTTWLNLGSIRRNRAMPRY